MIIGQKEFDVGNRTYIMGILNITPDSFSDGGRYRDREAALRQAEKLILDGADIIDVGGESTRPGHQPVGEEEEMERILPIIRLIHDNFDIPVSVDTCKSKVARQAVEAGAAMVNDIWGLKKDKDMAGTIAGLGVCCCLMHNRQSPVRHHFMNTMMEELNETILLAKQAGIKDDRIILDPGVGFGKTYEMNLEVIKNLSAFKRFGYPVLLGASRKSVIGVALDLAVEQREEGTLVTTAAAVFSGCSFVRVHDVEGNKRAVRMAEAIMGARDFRQGIQDMNRERKRTGHGPNQD